MTTSEMTPGYDSILHGAAVLDLSARGRIRVTGEDRARLLHAMTTNHVQQLKPGEGLYAFFLNAQGRIQGDAYILCFDDHLLLDTEPATRARIFEHLDKFIIADDVTLEDITEQTFCFGVEGPTAFEVTSSIGLPAPQQSAAHASWGEYDAAAISATGTRAVRIYGALRRREELLQLLESAGALAGSEQDADLARMRNFQPRYGVDFTEATLPQETQLTHALHFQKGCYLGQEIVERVRSRGHVNKHLMGFRMTSGSAPLKGTALLAGEKETGEVTSAGLTPEGKVYGLASVRVPNNKPGSLVEIEGHTAELFAPHLPELF